MLLDLLHVFIGEMLLRSSVYCCISCLIFLILNCMSCLYISEINPLLFTSFADIFSHYVGCLFCFVYVQKLLSLIASHLLIFIFITLGGGTKKIFQSFMTEIMLTIFSSKSFIVSSLTFMSLIHFQSIFVYGVREYSNLIILHLAVQFSQYHLFKILSFLHCVFLHCLS